MVELSRYQQLLAAKFPAQRVRADGSTGLTRSPRPGLYANNLPDTALQPRSSPSALSNSSLAPQDQSTSTAGPSYTDRSHQSNGNGNINGKTLSPYGNDASTYPTLEHVQPGNFSNHPTSYHSFNSAEQPASSSSSFSPSPSQAFLDMPNQTSLLSFAGNKFNPYSPGPFGVGCGAGDSPLVQLSPQGQHVPEAVPPTSWPATSNGGGGASTQSSLQGQQSDSSAQWMANQPSSSSASSYLRPGSFSSHGQFQPVDQGPSAYSSNQGVSSSTYRHSLPYNSTLDGMHDPAGDRRHHSASALQPNSQPSTSTFDFSTTYNPEAFNAAPSAYYPTVFSREAYADTLSNGPSPGSQPSWMTMPAGAGPSSITTSFTAPAPSAVPGDVGPSVNPGILPPPSAKTERVPATKNAQELKLELSAVAKGKRPAVDKKGPKSTTTPPLMEAADSAAEPGGSDKAGEFRKAPLACHFCRGRKLKCVVLLKPSASLWLLTLTTVPFLFQMRRHPTNLLQLRQTQPRLHSRRRHPPSRTGQEKEGAQPARVDRCHSRHRSACPSVLYSRTTSRRVPSSSSSGRFDATPTRTGASPGSSSRLRPGVDHDSSPAELPSTVPAASTLELGLVRQPLPVLDQIDLSSFFPCLATPTTPYHLSVFQLSSTPFSTS